MISFLAIVLISFSKSSNAQSSVIGIKSGLNLSNLNYKNDLQGYEFSFRKGLNLGLFGEFFLNNNFSLHLEIIYSERGTKYSTEEKPFNDHIIPEQSFIQNVDYLELPIFIQYNFINNSAITPKLFLGPFISYLLSANLELDWKNTKTDDLNQKDYFKSTDYGIIVGAGIAYSLKSGRLLLDIRYQFGLQNISSIERGSEIKTSTLSLNIGYGFNLN